MGLGYAKWSGSNPVLRSAEMYYAARRCLRLRVLTEMGFLTRPFGRKWFQQIFHSQMGRMPAIHDRLHNCRRQKSRSRDATDFMGSG